MRTCYICNCVHALGESCNNYAQNKKLQQVKLTYCSLNNKLNSCCGVTSSSSCTFAYSAM